MPVVRVASCELRVASHIASYELLVTLRVASCELIFECK